MVKRLTKKQIEKRVMRRPERKVSDESNKRSYHLVIVVLVVALVLTVSAFAFYIYRNNSRPGNDFGETGFPMGPGERGNFSELIDSCEGLSEGDSCEVQSTSGICELTREGNLICLPERR